MAAGEFGQHAASQNATQGASEVEKADDGVAQSPTLAKIKKVIAELLTNKYYECLHNEFKEDYSKWSSDRKIEYVFHYALRCREWDKPALDFIDAVIEKCLYLETQDGGRKVLEYLFQLETPDGYVPFVLAILNRSEKYLKDFLTRMRKDSISSYSILLETGRRGWRPIHMIVTLFTTHEILQEVVKGKIDVNARLPSSEATVLHLAIFHDRPETVKIILEADEVDVNAILERDIVYGSKRRNGKKRSSRYWSPLQLAAIMGRAEVVRILLTKIEKIYDSSKRSNQGLKPPKKYDGNIPALHLAAASGVPEVMRMFITKEFDPIKLTPHDNRTPIHFAIDSSTAKLNNEVEVKSNDTNEESSPMTGPGPCVDPFAIDTETRPDTNLRSEPAGNDEDRLACITMLMQAGVDIWQRDYEHTLAEPGPEASTYLRKWWYEAIAREISEAKKYLNDAANAISVVAALVATASYVGPLQPPLGYGTTDPSVLDLVQTTKLSIRVFVVSNCLSFYLAIGSILFAVVPSLPAPQESLHEEWRRSKRTIGIATLFLLISLLGVLISFAAASNAGMADDYSWHGSGLAFYPTLFGGLVCLFGIKTCFVRLLWLVFYKDVRVHGRFNTTVEKASGRSRMLGQDMAI